MKSRLLKSILLFLFFINGFFLLVYADRPFLCVYMIHNKDIGSLIIKSDISWNSTLTNSKIKKLWDKDIFCISSKAYKIERYKSIADKNIRINIYFPAQEWGRRLNQSTRVDLSLHYEDKLLFHSKNFGQHSQEFTDMPTHSGIKFRPQSLKILSGNDLGKFYFNVSIYGVFGTPDYSEGFEIEKGLSFETKIFSEVVKRIDDTTMNRLVK